MTRQNGRSVFADLAVAPPDAVFLVSSKFREDANPKKVNMGVGGGLQRLLLAVWPQHNLADVKKPDPILRGPANQKDAMQG